MPRVSAGLLMYRTTASGSEVFLVHPGGPFFRKKDLGAWTIPKGEIEPDEDALATAQREFMEETAITPCPPFHSLGSIVQKGGKRVHAWAFACETLPEKFISNTFTMEWPPRSGKQQTFDEIDQAEFFDLPTARRKINAAQAELLDRFENLMQEQA